MSAGAAQPIFSLLGASNPGACLVRAVGRREAWLPSFLALADDIPAGPRPWHSGSVLGHTARCMDSVAQDPLAVWMALAHDAGKLTTPAGLWPHHYGHELRGKQLASVWAAQLGLPDAYRRAGIMAALLHMKAGRYALLRPGKKLDLLNELGASGFFHSFWKMVDADTRSDISKVAARDWELVRSVPHVAGEERQRQQAIALLLANDRDRPDRGKIRDISPGSPDIRKKA